MDDETIQKEFERANRRFASQTAKIFKALDTAEEKRRKMGDEFFALSCMEGEIYLESIHYAADIFIKDFIMRAPFTEKCIEVLQTIMDRMSALSDRNSLPGEAATANSDYDPTVLHWLHKIMEMARRGTPPQSQVNTFALKQLNTLRKNEGLSHVLEETATYIDPRLIPDPYGHMREVG